MKELVFHRQFFPAIERWPDKVGFHDGDYHATFQQHGDRVLRLADGMRRHLGLSTGDRFAVMSANSHQYLELYHAGFLGAGVINPLNLRLAGAELQHILADSGTEVVFVDALFAEHFARHIDPVRHELPLQHVVLIGGGDAPHDFRYEDLITDGDPVVPHEPKETDPAVLMYTGGTTGMAKGALLEQRAEILNLYHIGLALGFGEQRVYLHQTPMFHAASMGGIIGIPATGGTSVFVPLFDPVPVMDAIEHYGVDWTMMVPTMIAMVMNHPEFSPDKLVVPSRPRLRRVADAGGAARAIDEGVPRSQPLAGLWHDGVLVRADLPHRRRSPPGRRDPALGRTPGHGRQPRRA